MTPHPPEIERGKPAKRLAASSNPFHEGYYSVFENEQDSDGYRNSKLYRFNAGSGVIENGSGAHDHPVRQQYCR